MAANRQVERPGSRPKSKAVKDTDKVEDKLLDIYGGRDPAALPTTLMFDHVSPATRLLEKRRQMFEVQEALNSQKDEFNRREDAYRRREDGLRRKDLELQESLIFGHERLARELQYIKAFSIELRVENPCMRYILRMY